MPPDFGAFAPLFAESGHYLALLRLQSNDSADVVKNVQQCAQQATHPQRDIHTLLIDFNWRPTLVACVAALWVKPDPAIIAALWSRLDAGSWVVPQIAVVLAQIDPDFMDHARARLETQCPIALSGLLGMQPAGPPSASLVHLSGKAANARASLARQHTPRPSWLEAVTSSAAHQSLIAEDFDNAYKIAESWQQRLTAILQTLPE
jgi:hypothetical protein